MKKIFSLLFVVALFTACNSSGTKTQAKSPPDLAAVKTVQLHVTGMTCEGCENTVMSKVNEIDGVTESKASHVAELATVSFDSTRTNIAAISETINKLGYAVEGEVKAANPQSPE
ncbi:MAG: cation transporter [Lentimicrobium sp.]|jgi:copper chaperone CopZ|nr:cation transporter [Lentimicrobium sp.]